MEKFLWCTLRAELPRGTRATDVSPHSLVRPKLAVVALAWKSHAGHALLAATAVRIGGEYLQRPGTLGIILGDHVRLWE